MIVSKGLQLGQVCAALSEIHVSVCRAARHAAHLFKQEGFPLTVLYLCPEFEQGAAEAEVIGDVGGHVSLPISFTGWWGLSAGRVRPVCRQF